MTSVGKLSNTNIASTDNLANTDKTQNKGSSPLLKSLLSLTGCLAITFALGKYAPKIAAKINYSAGRSKCQPILELIGITGLVSYIGAIFSSMLFVNSIFDNISPDSTTAYNAAVLAKHGKSPSIFTDTENSTDKGQIIAKDSKKTDKIDSDKNENEIPPTISKEYVAYTKDSLNSYSSLGLEINKN